jgi:hypothetical protein
MRLSKATLAVGAAVILLSFVYINVSIGGLAEIHKRFRWGNHHMGFQAFDKRGGAIYPLENPLVPSALLLVALHCGDEDRKKTRIKLFVSIPCLEMDHCPDDAAASVYENCPLNT